MKKFIFLIAVLFILLPLFGDKATSTSTMELSGYKLGDSSFIENTSVTVGTFRSKIITGEANEYVLFDESQGVNILSESYSLEDAFFIKISTTGKVPISATITLTPFINSNDNSKTIKAIYNYSGTTNSPAKTSTSYTAFLKVSNTKYSCRAFKYTPELTLTIRNGRTLNNGGDSLEVGSATTLELTQRIKSVSFNYKTSNSWNNTTSLPYPSAADLTEYSGTGNNSSVYNYTVLPPHSAPPTLSSEARFDLSIDPNDLQAVVANTEYAATVIITITSGT